MDARDVMTTAVVTASPDTPMREIAELLLKHGISAVPVVDSDGAVIGMVSEGDLLRASAEDRAARRDWWLALLAKGDSPSPETLAALGTSMRTAHTVMTAPVVTVSEHTDIAEIGKLLEAHKIKRVPVVRDGKLSGVVSRADLIRAFASQAPASAPHQKSGLFSWSTHHENPAPQKEASEHPIDPNPSAESVVSASEFRSLVEAAASKRAAEREAARRAATGEREHLVQEAVDHHFTDEHWRSILSQARFAAARGETEMLVIRFPSELCSDHGRAINVAEPDWPATLRGEAAEAFLRYERELKPLGFHMAARVLDFPGGFIGDIGLFLSWGGAG